jgi:hypothetical protein
MIVELMSRKSRKIIKKEALSLIDGVVLTAKILLFPFMFVISLVILQFILIRKHQ